MNGKTKAGFDPNQPRDEGGKWASTGAKRKEEAETLEEFEEAIKNQGFESAAYFDASGVRLFWKDGEKAQVDTSEFEHLYEQFPMGTFTHNHPSNRNLSMQDIFMQAAVGVKRMRAVTKDAVYESTLTYMGEQLQGEDKKWLAEELKLRWNQSEMVAKGITDKWFYNAMQATTDPYEKDRIVERANVEFFENHAKDFFGSDWAQRWFTYRKIDKS